jgi:tetratricopeptide (TPR) repeat protein
MLWLQAAIVFGFAFLLYANTLGHQYAVDDTLVILDNRLTKQGVEAIPEIMTTDAFYGFFGQDYKFVAGGRYRPLSLVTFAVEWELFGKAPFVSHLVNVVLYGLTGVVLLFLFYRLLRTNIPESWALTVPFMAALLYIGHPVHTEAVANIKGRDEIMGFLFAVLTLWFSIRYVMSERIRELIIALGMFILALLSKENPITFLAVIPLAMYVFTGAKPLHYAYTMIPLLVLSGVYIYLRQTFTDVALDAKTNEVLNQPFLYASVSEKYATISHILGKYLKLLFIPHPLSHDYYYNQIPMIGWGNIKSWGLLLINLGLGGYALYRLPKRDALSFAILYYFITLSIVSNIVVVVGTTMSERFLFMPSLGFALAIAVLLQRLASKLSNTNLTVQSSFWSPAVVGILIAVLGLYSFKTVHRNQAWKNDFTLFQTDVKHSPNSAKLRNALGGELVAQSKEVDSEAKKEQYLNRAIKHLNKAIDIYPTYLNAWLLLGNAHYNLTDDPDQAKPYYEKTIELKPSYFEGNYNLGSIYLENDDYKKAIPYLKEAVKIEPQKFEPRYNLAEAYLKGGQPDQAIEEYNKLLEERPQMANLYYKLGLAYGKRKGNYNEGIRYIKKAIEMDPENATYYEDLGVAYGMKEEYRNAIDAFQKAIDLRPNYAKIYQNLGVTYKQLGNDQKAQEYFQKAQQLQNK